jgi:uncharacterized protein YcfJ
MDRKSFCVFVFASLFLTGCVEQPYRPIVDTGQRIGNYDEDLNACTAIASQVQPANNAAAGIVAGAIIGALLGKAAGLNNHYAGQVAATGAVAGGVNGLAYGSAEWTAIVNRCMAGRGYNVLQ